MTSGNGGPRGQDISNREACATKRTQGGEEVFTADRNEFAGGGFDSNR